MLGLIYARLCAFWISGAGKTAGVAARLAASSDDYPEAGVGPEARRNKYVDKYPPYLYSGCRMPAIKTESRFSGSGGGGSGNGGRPRRGRGNVAAFSFEKLPIRGLAFIAVKPRPTTTTTTTLSSDCPLSGDSQRGKRVSTRYPGNDRGKERWPDEKIPRLVFGTR